MPFTLRLSRRFLVQYTATYNTGPFLKLLLIYVLILGSLLILLVLSSRPAYAGWVQIDKNANEMTAYADPNTIRRKGDLVKMWAMYDEKVVGNFLGSAYLSIREQSEYDCAEARMRNLAISIHSGNMGAGKTVYSDSDVGEWVPVASGSVGKVMWAIACYKK